MGELESGERDTGERQKASEKAEGTGVWDSYEIHPSYLLTASLSSFEPQHQVRDKYEERVFFVSFSLLETLKQMGV